MPAGSELRCTIPPLVPWALTPSVFRLRCMVPDGLIPGTLDVGHALLVASIVVYTASLLLRSAWAGRRRARVRAAIVNHDVAH